MFTLKRATGFLALLALLLSSTPMAYALNATPISSGAIESISLASYTLEPKANLEVNVLMGARVGDVSAEADGDYVEFIGFISKHPSGGWVRVSADHSVDLASASDHELWEDASASVDESGGASDDIAESTTADGYYKVELSDAAASNAAGDVIATARSGAAEFNFTPIVAGEYELTVFADIDGDAKYDIGEAQDRIVINVAEAPIPNFATSLIRIAPTTTVGSPQGSTTEGNYTEVEDTRVYAAEKSSNTAQKRIATIQVLLLNNDGTPAFDGHVVTVDVEGSVLINVNSRSGAEDGAVRSDAYTLTKDAENIAWIHLNSDVSAGPGTVLIYVTNAITGEKKLIASKSIYSYGDLAKLELVKSNFSIGLAGYTTGAATSTRLANAEIGSPTAASSVGIQGNGGQTTTPAFIIKATDTLGQLMNLDSPPEVVSSDLTVVTGGACSQDDGTTSYSSGKGYGYYNCFFSVASAAKSGDKATLTIRSLDPARAAGTTSYISTTYNVSVGGYETKGQVTMSFDKPAYDAGEAMIVTLKATDEAGNPVFDGHPSPAVTFNRGASGTFAAGVFIGGKRDSSKVDLFAPEVSGVFKAITTTASGKELSAVSEVKGSDIKASTAVVEASAKVVAASADAAKALKRAQDAAARATTAATKARASADKTSDAVEKLTNQFDTNLNSLQAELARLINTITSIITKI